MAFNLTRRTSTSEAMITVGTDKLGQYLESINFIVQKKSTVPLLKTIRIFCVEGKACFRATDTNLFVDMTLPVGTCKGSIDVCVDYAELLSVVTKAPKGLMAIERNGNMLTYKVGYSVCGETSCIPGNDYPSLDVLDESSVVPYELTSFDISYINSHLSSICIEDKDYSGISGILVESDGVSCSFTATDRKMLVSTNINIKPLHQYALPNAVFKVMSSFDAPCQLYLTKSQYLLTSNHIKMYGAPLKGIFPDVHKVMPTKFDHEHRVNVGVLRKEVQTLMSMVKPINEGIYPIMLSYAEAEIHAVEVPSDYVLDKGGIKMDAVRILKLLGRFDDNSDVTFKSTCILERPTVWQDCRGTSLLCGLR